MNFGHLTRGLLQLLILAGARVSFRTVRTYCSVFGHRWSRESAQAWVHKGTPIRCERCTLTFEPYLGTR